MIAQLLEIENPQQAAGLMRSIGVNPFGVRLMRDKAVFFCVKVFGLKPAAANIIKQEMLAIGGEAAVAHGAVNCSAASSSALLFATAKQYRLLIAKLKKHQFGLPVLAGEVETALYHTLIHLRFLEPAEKS